METKRDLAAQASELPLHPQDEVECRRCGVHCDKVVHPSACVERGCAFLYSYEEFGHTYVGCMQKVFDVEIDLDLLRAAEATGEFGAVKATRKPLPICRAEVESCLRQPHRRGRLPQPRILRAAGGRTQLPRLRRSAFESRACLAERAGRAAAAFLAASQATPQTDFPRLRADPPGRFFIARA
jgi:hypothetical protein